MRPMKAYFFSIFLSSVFLAFGLEGHGQGKKIDKSYGWEYAVNGDVKLTFNNYDCNLVIHTWDKATIEYKMTLDATLRSEEDAKRLDGYIQNLEFSHSAGSVEFDNKFWLSRKSMMGKKTIGLRGEKTIRYSDFNMSGELWIPKGCNLVLTSKYSVIELEALMGTASLTLYNDKLYAKDIENTLSVEAKYSTVELGDAGDVSANLYNSDLETGNIGNFAIQSKYSKIRVGNAASVTINSYSDKYTLGDTRDIRFTDKYSHLNAEHIGNLIVDGYTSNVVIAGVQNTELKSKYGKFEIGSMENLHISSSYSDNFQLQTLSTLNVSESKYCTFKVDHLSSQLRVKEGYSDKFYLAHTGSEFKGIKVNGKYLKIEMAVDEALNYRFNASLKYPKLDIDEESMDVRIKVFESSQLEMKAIKGAEKEGMAEFEVKGYDVALTFTKD